jgi:hypothetical protein
VEKEQPGVLEKLSAPDGFVRDARYLESHLQGLLITADNFSTLVSGYILPNKPKQLARQMLRILENHCLILENQDVLAEIEDRWTGQFWTRRPVESPDKSSTVFAEFRVSYYLCYGCEQVRELNYLAVTEEAVTLLRNFRSEREDHSLLPILLGGLRAWISSRPLVVFIGKAFKRT